MIHFFFFLTTDNLVLTFYVLSEAILICYLQYSWEP